MRIRSTLFVVMVFLLAATVLAQPQRMTLQERTDQLAKQLALTAEQKAKVLEVFAKQDSARQKAFANNRGDREAMRATMQKMREETANKLKAILTEEQYTKYEKLRSEMGPPGGMGRRPN
jgi:Spy/CpxP family protein refolding chaperone